MVDHDETNEEDDWTEEQYPLVDADFVGDCLERVLNDQSEIADEAARVEEIRFDTAFLGAFAIPEPTADFVDRTLATVIADRSARGERETADDAELLDLMQANHVSAPSPDFVERTLQAVMTDRANRRSSNAAWRRRFAVVASVAAIVLCGVAIFWPNGAQTDHDARSSVQAQPIAWAALLRESDTGDEFDLRIVIQDPLSRFLADVGSQGRRGR